MNTSDLGYVDAMDGQILMLWDDFCVLNRYHEGS